MFRWFWTIFSLGAPVSLINSSLYSSSNALIISFYVLLIQSMSEVQVHAEINGLFNDMRMRRTHKFALFDIEGKKKIVADVCSDPCKTKTKEEDEVQFHRMKEQLTNEPRYILYDFGFMKKDGRRVNKLAFIFWWVRLFSVFIASDSAQYFPLVSRHFRLDFTSSTESEL